MSKKKINALQVRNALLKLAKEQPDRVDRRADSGVLNPAYIEHGKPSCIVSQVMHDLGLSIAMIKQLDRESKGPGGITLRFSTCLIRRRFTPAAWVLLDAVQRQNDRGRTWGQCVGGVLDDITSIQRYPHLGKLYPWLAEIQELETGTDG